MSREGENPGSWQFRQEFLENNSLYSFPWFVECSGIVEKDPNYLVQLFEFAWDAAEKGSVVVELVIAFIVVFAIRTLEKRDKLPAFLKIFAKHPILEDDKYRLAMTFGILFVLQIIFISPYSLYKKNHYTIKRLQTIVDDRSPKLDGFVDQYTIFDEPDGTNTIIVPQLHINNSGVSASLAENFKLQLMVGTNKAIESRPIDIPDYYEWKATKGDRLTVFRLLKQELISEKAGAAIEPGSGPRGWLAFRVPGLLSAAQKTNATFTISFLNASGNEVFVTNGMRRGKSLTNKVFGEIPQTLPGSVNLVYTNYQLQSDIANGWRPPELPPGCSNVVILFGLNGMIYSRFMAQISPDEGTKFPIKDVPDFFLSGLENATNYSHRQSDIWLRYSNMMAVGGKTFPYPVQPIIISNRLFVEVEVPFSNEKHKLVMSDSFDPELPIPRLWDRNFSTNYNATSGIYAYEVVNELTNPVLQVVYTSPTEVRVNGIFQVDSNSILAAFGESPQLLTFTIGTDDHTNGTITASLQAETFRETLTIDSNETVASFGKRLTNEFFKPIFKYQRPLFKYPSNRHIGEFSEWAMMTNNSDTNIVERHQ